MSNVVDFLEWDSNFFGKRIGKISLNKNNEQTLLNEELKSFDLVYLFSEDDNLSYPLMDKKVVYLIEDLRKVDHIENLQYDYYLDGADSYNELLSLALQSGAYSRFKIDQNFEDGAYEKLYKEWLDNSISKAIATDIIVKRIDQKIVGFATLGRKSEGLADIGLVAVDEAYRGRGIAKELMTMAKNLAKDQGYQKLQVVTQLDNEPANLLYKKAGFNIHSITYIYHIWK